VSCMPVFATRDLLQNSCDSIAIRLVRADGVCAGDGSCCSDYKMVSGMLEPQRLHSLAAFYYSPMLVLL
jgi:hypothetical protein